MKLLVLVLSFAAVSVMAGERQCYAKKKGFFSVKRYESCEACLDKKKKCKEYCGEVQWMCSATKYGAYSNADGRGIEYTAWSPTKSIARNQVMRDCKTESYGTGVCILGSCWEDVKVNTTSVCKKN